jgi:hypothetical protein
MKNTARTNRRDQDILEQDLTMLLTQDQMSYLPHAEFEQALEAHLNQQAALMPRPQIARSLGIGDKLSHSLKVLFRPLQYFFRAHQLAAIFVCVMLSSVIGFAASEDVRELILAPFESKAWLEITYVENEQACELSAPIILIDADIEARIPLRLKLPVGNHTLTIKRAGVDNFSESLDLKSEGMTISVSCSADGNEWTLRTQSGKDEGSSTTSPLPPISTPLSPPTPSPLEPPISNPTPENPVVPDPSDPSPEPDPDPNPIPPIDPQPVEPPQPQAPDTTPPTITNISFNQPSIQAGTTITATINMQEDGSGVYYVAMVLVSPSGQQSVSNTGWPTTGQTSINLDFTIPAASETGIWKIRDASIYDNASNETNYDTADFPDTFAVTANPVNPPDTTPPKITNISFNQTSIQAGATITATINMQEDGSGVYYVAMVLVSPSGKQSVSNTGWPTPGQTSISLDFAVPTAAELGIWKIRDMSIYDNVGNETNYDTADFPDTFEVTTNPDNPPDTTPPEIINFNFNSTSIKAGKTISATIDMHETGSGVWYIAVVLISPSGQQSVSNTGWPTVGQTSIVLDFAIPATAEAGVWKIRDMSIYDNVGNETNYDTTDFPDTFEVTR